MKGTRRSGGRLAVVALAAIVGILVGACLPRLTPLSGAPAPARMPTPRIAAGHWEMMFSWELEDPELGGKGEGVARIAAPDRVRLDFFLAGGFISGAAVVIGDSLRLPSLEVVRRLIPPPPMLWAALGRSALPPVADTVVRIDGGLLRADLGRPTEWRVTFRGDSLIRVDRIRGGRLVEWIERTDSSQIRYRNESARRTLTLRIKSIHEVPEFDASIWRFSG